VIILLKAAIPGGASSDLFATPVDVTGYTTKRGTYVAPHRGVRHKRQASAVGPAQASLFDSPKPTAVQPTLFGDAAPAPARKPSDAVAPVGDGLRKLAEFITAHAGKDALTAKLKAAKPMERARAVQLMAQIGGLHIHQVEALLGLRAPADGGSDPMPAPEPAPDVPHEGEELENVDGLPVGARLYQDGRGLAAGKWRVKDAAGEPLGNFQATREAAVAEARQWHSNRLHSAKQAETSARHKADIRERLLAGQELSDADLKLLNLNPRSARFEWLSPAVQDVLGIPKHKVREAMGNALHQGTTDMGRKVWFANARKALANAAAWSKENAAPSASPTNEGASAEAKPLQWGVPTGTTKKARKAANARALAILKDKTDDQMTAEDRAVLAQYTGRGGVGDSLNEFYTDPAVAGAMWSMLTNLGFTGGEVLEPSSATGAFLHTAPAGARVTAVEMDPISSRIARILHTQAGHEVHTASLERFATQDGRQYDAVIGNVPFGLRGSVVKDDKPDLATAEAYFVDTALDKCRDGGLVALIVPTGLMDSQNGRAVRERLMRKGEFLGAHRLPNTAFSAAHTAVTSDIVIFRKRPQDVAGALSTLTQDQLQALGVWDADMLGGTYFSDGRGAGHVMGRLEEGWRAKAGIGQDITVSGSMEGVPEALAAWRPEDMGGTSPTVTQILKHLGDDTAAKRRAVNAALKNPYQVAKPGDVKVVNGERYILQGDPPRWHRTEEETPAAVEDAHRIAELLEDLADGRAKDPRFARAQLAELLDDYVATHGAPHRNKDLRQWLQAPILLREKGRSDEDHAYDVDRARRRVARLLGAVHDDGTYSDLVTGRTREAGGADLDTIATKIALESGGFTVDQLAAAWGHGDREAVLDHLFASPAFAVDPDGQTWTTMDAYLSGDLWQRYDAAKAALAHEGLSDAYRGKYQRQVAALEEAIAPQSLEDVEISLNSGFIKPTVLTAWFAARRATFMEKHPGASWAPGAVDVSYDDGLYRLRPDGFNHDAELVEKFLNRAGVRKDDRDKVARLQKEFRDWLLGSEWRDQVEEAYNRTYRGFVPKAYSDAPIAIPGLNPALDVNGYHFAGLRWALEAGKGIIAADVGLGKTGRGLMLAKLAKVTGQAKRPTFVVPKSVLANWVKEAEFWFPGSKVLVIGETYSRDKVGNLVSKSDNEETRRRKYHELQQNEYDFVFISQPAWNDLDVDPITKGQYANDDFWTKRGDKLGNAGDKRLNQIRTAHEQALAKREFGKREGTVYFNDLGIDMLLMDEGQAYKNLYAARNRFGESPKFLGGSGLSNRAQDTYFKSRSLRDANGGKGIYMLTATPTKNSPLEIYSMLSHIAPEAFERMGIKNSEDFLDRFCEFKEDTILTVDGQVEEALVTAGFKNLGELREVMRRFIDRKTAADVGLQLPARQDHQHLIDMTSEQEAVYQELRQAAADKASGDDTGDAHIFSIMDKMGKASLDLELLGPQHKGARSPKIEAVAANVAKLSTDGGQVVFCEAVAAHEKIATALVAAGIPRDQIGIINAKAASTSAARQRISDDFNSGKLKVVIGNKTMEEGVNLQKMTTDLHHCDLPWEPSTLQQRNGRGLRQGNTREAVRIHTYMAKGSFDGYRYQTILSKKDWQDLLWNGGDRVENLAREGAFSRQDMLIMLAAHPEEARAKYEADKAAAAERKTAEERGRAVDMFGRFQEMTASLKKLNASGAKGRAADRLAVKMALLREALRDSRYFNHKDLLDGGEPALIEPVTNHAWAKNRAFEMVGGSEAPVNWSSTPSKWVVTSVDLEDGKLHCRQWGRADGHTLDIPIGKMKSGVTPFGYDEDAEAAEIQVAAEAKAVSGVGTATTPAALKHLPKDMLERMAPTLQFQLKDAIRNYRDHGHSGPYGMIDAAGNPVAYASFDGRRMIGTHDLIVPTDEGRRLAIEGYVRAALKRKIKTRYAEGRRTTYGGAKAVGIEPAYPGFEYGADRGNPWASIMHNLFDPSARAEADQEVHRRALANIEDSPTFHDAVRSALPTLDLSRPANGALEDKAWPEETARALARKAKALGVLDHPIKEVVPLSSFNDDKVHPEVFRVAKRGNAYRTTDSGVSVRDFLLNAMRTDEAAAALHEELSK